MLFTMSPSSGQAVYNNKRSMPGTLGEKAERVFMIIRAVSRVVLGAIAIALSACSPDLSDDQIPYQPFPDIVLNLNLPDNIILKSKGISKEIDGGVRGIIIYCHDLGVYSAYERNCSYHPNEACATVNVDNSKLFMFDPCCGSSFDFATGNPTGGIAWRPLVEYRTTFNGVDLIITDEVIN
jgi:hypothetical protein